MFNMLQGPGMAMPGMPNMPQMPQDQNSRIKKSNSINSMASTFSDDSSEGKPKDPIYAVRWIKPKAGQVSWITEMPKMHVAYLSENKPWPKPSADAVVVLVAGATTKAADDMIAEQQRECWHFFQAVQSWLEAGAS